jgi:hypothetical protein
MMNLPAVGGTELVIRRGAAEEQSVQRLIAIYFL